MKRFLWRLPLLALVFAGAFPSFRAPASPKAAAAAFVAAQETARIEPNVPVLPLITRGGDSGGALKLLAIVLGADRDGSRAPSFVAFARVLNSASARAASPCLGRAPPAAL